jgi:hypothetical protein
MHVMHESPTMGSTKGSTLLLFVGKTLVFHVVPKEIIEKKLHFVLSALQKHQENKPSTKAWIQ